MSEGIKVMLPGNDIKDSNPQSIAYSSNENHFNILLGQQPPQFGTLNYIFNSKPTDPSSGQTAITNLFTIVHGLGYIPAALVYMFISQQNNAANMLAQSSYYALPILMDTGDFATEYMSYATDSQNLYINYVVTNTGLASILDPTGMQVTFKYYIFSAPGA